MTTAASSRKQCLCGRERLYAGWEGVGMRRKETRVSRERRCCGSLCGVPSSTTEKFGVISPLPVQYNDTALPYATTFLSRKNRKGHES